MPGPFIPASAAPRPPRWSLTGSCTSPPTTGSLPCRPETGKVIWQYEATSVAKRGMAYWPGNRQTHPRVYAGVASTLVAVDVITGKLPPRSARKAAIDLKDGVLGDLPDAPVSLQSPPSVYKDVIITGSNNGEGFPSQGAYGDSAGGTRIAESCFGRSTQFRARASPAARPGNSPTVGRTAPARMRGASSPSTRRRGMVYVPLGCPTSDFYGADRPVKGSTATRWWRSTPPPAS